MEENKDLTVGEPIGVDTSENATPTAESVEPENTPETENEWKSAEPDENASEYIYNWSVKESAPPQTDKKRVSPTVALLCVVCVTLALAVIFLICAVAFGERGGVREDGVSVAQIAAECSRFTVAIQTTTSSAVGTGTGIILTENGYIATNSHVVDEAQNITVYTSDGQSYSGTVIADDPARDIALIRIRPDASVKLPYAPIGNIADVSVGDRVVAIGTPHSIEYAWTVSVGYVSYVGRSVSTASVKMIQTDTPVNPGNSGGPLINSKGEVIGIVSAKLNEDYEGINFAIPMSVVQKFFTDNIIADMEKPQLGVSGASIVGGYEYFVLDRTIYHVSTDETGKYIVMNYQYDRYLTEEELASPEFIVADKSGFLLTGINDNSGAKGKLQIYDVIIEFDGQELIYDNEQNPYDMIISILGEKKASDTVKVKYTRNGREYETEIFLSEKE